MRTSEQITADIVAIDELPFASMTEEQFREYLQTRADLFFERRRAWEREQNIAIVHDDGTPV